MRRTRIAEEALLSIFENRKPSLFQPAASSKPSSTESGMESADNLSLGNDEKHQQLVQKPRTNTVASQCVVDGNQMELCYLLINSKETGVLTAQHAKERISIIRWMESMILEARLEEKYQRDRIMRERRDEIEQMRMICLAFAPLGRKNQKRQNQSEIENHEKKISFEDSTSEKTFASCTNNTLGFRINRIFSKSDKALSRDFFYMERISRDEILEHQQDAFNLILIKFELVSYKGHDIKIKNYFSEGGKKKHELENNDLTIRKMLEKEKESRLVIEQEEFSQVCLIKEFYSILNTEIFKFADANNVLVTHISNNHKQAAHIRKAMLIDQEEYIRDQIQENENDMWNFILLEISFFDKVVKARQRQRSSISLRDMIKQASRKSQDFIHTNRRESSSTPINQVRSLNTPYNDNKKKNSVNDKNPKLPMTTKSKKILENSVEKKAKLSIYCKSSSNKKPNNRNFEVNQLDEAISSTAHNSLVEQIYAKRNSVKKAPHPPKNKKDNYWPGF